MTKAAIAEAVSFAKDPTLKALLQVKYFLNDSVSGEVKNLPATFGDVTDSITAIDALLKADRQSIDAWYLAASLAADEKRWGDAADKFEKMRSLPMNAQYLSLIHI